MTKPDAVTGLSKLERLQLINQLRILERLYPDDADYYGRHRTALEEGYTLHYDWLFEHLYDELPVDDCREVLNILDMYRAITYSYKGLQETQKKQIPQAWLEFRGFDGNEEAHRVGYVRYFVVQLERYQELKYGKDDADFNSHMPTLGKYRAMLREWHDRHARHELTADDLVRILEAE